MANWIGCSRTNYFKVKDELSYEKLFQGLASEGYIDDFTCDHGHAFGTYGDIMWFPPVDDNGHLRGSFDYEDDGDVFRFVKQISSILTNDSVFALFTVGHEKLRYLTGTCIYVFPGETPRYKEIEDDLIRDCKKKFGDEYDLRYTY